jgi:hypothetical protein
VAPVVTSAEIERPAAEVFAYAPRTRPGSASGRRAWWTGTWTARATAPGDGTGTPAVGAKCVTPRRIGGASRLSTSDAYRPA